MSAGIAGGAIAAAIAIGGAVIPALGAPGDEKGAYEALTPVRIFDTRTGLGGPAGAFTAGQTRQVQVTGVGGVPANATGVVLNVTLDRPSADTFVTVWPSGAPMPNSSTINATAGDLIANMVTLRVGAGGMVSVFNYAGNSQVIFDIAGYYVDRESPKVGTVHLTSALVPAGPAAEVTNFTTTAPAAGVLVVTVEGHAWLDLDAPGATSVKGGGTLGLCTATAVLDETSCGFGPGEARQYWSEDADAANDDNTTDAFSITRVIPVAAGSTTLYLNAMSATTAPFGTYSHLDATVTWMPGTATLPVVEGP